MTPKRLWKYRGLMVIVLWQAAPPVRKNEDGNVQFGFAYGESRIDEYIFAGGGCEGTEPVTTTYKRHRPRSVGVTGSFWPSRKLRLAGGIATTSADTTSLSGLQAKGALAGEWKWVGVGTGFVLDRGEPLPGLYLRLGPLSSVHLRMEVPDASHAVSSTGVGRAGIAFNQESGTGIGAFVGVPVCYTTCVYGAGGLRGDLRIPLMQHVAIDLSGFTHDSSEEKYWGFSVGGRILR